jgi:hypothetical protein
MTATALVCTDLTQDGTPVAVAHVAAPGPDATRRRLDVRPSPTGALRTHIC